MALYSADQIKQAYIRACEADVDALKPGNVSRYAPGHGMTEELFRLSAIKTAPELVRPGVSLGASILASTKLTLQHAGCNTNLGILLLCTPIAHAALACETNCDLRRCVNQVIHSASAKDTQSVFDAISLMTPGGLGDSDEHDVRLPAETDLLTVMQYSADRDRIAWQYANSFDDVLSIGCKSFLRAVGETGTLDSQTLEGAAVAVFFEFLCSYPDSHIVRKHGAYMAEVVRDEAQKKRDSFTSLIEDDARHAFLLAYDQELKFRGINPGTSADLTVATLFVSLLLFRNPRYQTQV